jgi:hypothetical protein
MRHSDQILRILKASERRINHEVDNCVNDGVQRKRDGAEQLAAVAQIAVCYVYSDRVKMRSVGLSAKLLRTAVTVQK